MGRYHFMMNLMKDDYFTGLQFSSTKSVRQILIVIIFSIKNVLC